VPAIHLISTDGTGDITVVTNADEPTFGPSATQLAFVRDDDIFEINTDGTGITNLTNGNAGIGVSHPSFSPGGGQIAFSARPSTASLTPSIRLLALGNLQITDVIDDGTQPAFGPGSLLIAFVRNGQIFTINQSATNLQQLTAGPSDSNPSWTSSS
jgi:Tol biopolymer transport system component